MLNYSVVKQVVSSYLPKCYRDFLKNICNRGSRCKFYHPENIERQRGRDTSPSGREYNFCIDFQVISTLKFFQLLCSSPFDFLSLIFSIFLNSGETPSALNSMFAEDSHILT